MYLESIRFALRFREFKGTDFFFLDTVPNDEFYRIEIAPYSGLRRVNRRVSVSRALQSSSGKQGRLKEFLRAWWSVFDQLQFEHKLTGCWEFSGSDEGCPGLLSMEGRARDKVVPDLYAILDSKERKYTRWEDFASFEREFKERDSTVFWRGSTTGAIQGLSLEEKILSNSRISTCIFFRNYRPAFDARISRVTKLPELKTSDVVQVLSDWDILAPPVSEDFFRGFKYFPSLTGNAQPWGTLKKMAQGSLVFAPDLPSKLLYQFDLRPGVHYVQVRPDFKDLPEAVAWAQANPKQAVSIAFEGAQVAQSYLDNLPSTMSQILRSTSIA